MKTLLVLSWVTRAVVSRLTLSPCKITSWMATLSTVLSPTLFLISLTSLLLDLETSNLISSYMQLRQSSVRSQVSQETKDSWVTLTKATWFICSKAPSQHNLVGLLSSLSITTILITAFTTYGSRTCVRTDRQQMEPQLSILNWQQMVLSVSSRTLATSQSSAQTFPLSLRPITPLTVRSQARQSAAPLVASGWKMLRAIGPATCRSSLTTVGKQV